MGCSAAKVDKAGVTRTLSLEIVEINSTFDSADESLPKMHERTESCRWCGFVILVDPGQNN